MRDDIQIKRGHSCHRPRLAALPSPGTPGPSAAPSPRPQSLWWEIQEGCWAWLGLPGLALNSLGGQSTTLASDMRSYPCGSELQGSPAACRAHRPLQTVPWPLGQGPRAGPDPQGPWAPDTLLGTVSCSRPRLTHRHHWHSRGRHPISWS